LNESSTPGRPAQVITYEADSVVFDHGKALHSTSVFDLYAEVDRSLRHQGHSPTDEEIRAICARVLEVQRATRGPERHTDGVLRNLRRLFVGR